MPPPLSKSQLEKLGRRLRKADVPSDDDLQLLEGFRAAHDPALAVVEEALLGMGLHPTSRLKTVGTIIDKLVRERTRLGSMHDIAGVRIVEDVSLGGQDELVERILAQFGGEVIDRRTHPSHGYRAVHVVVEVEGCLVEIQVRTALQNLWAQIMETMGDRIGRGIRYGEMPRERGWAEFAAGVLGFAEVIAGHEALRADVERREAEITPWDVASSEFRDLKTQIEASGVVFKRALQQMLSRLEEGVFD